MPRQPGVDIPRAARVTSCAMFIKNHPHGITTRRLHLRARSGADATISAVAALSRLVSREDCWWFVQAPIGVAASDAVADTTDGVRVTTDDGWWLLWASNTQDVLVARAESESQEGLDRLVAQIDAQLEASGLQRGPQAGH